MANLSSPPSPVSTSSELSKLGLNPSSPLYLYQMEQLKMLQRSQGLPDLSMLYNNPTIFYTANPFWWQQLIFSLPPVFGNNNNVKKEKPESPKHESMSRDYILTPETPERDDQYEMDMDEPLNLSKKHCARETDISSSLHSPLLPPTPKINPNLFSGIWSPASLVSQNEKSFGFKSESEGSPTTPKMKFNFDNVRGLSIKRESSSQIDYDVLKKNCTDIFLMNNMNNNNNNNNSLMLNNNLNSTFNGIDCLSKAPKTSRKSLPLIKPDSTEHSDFVVREFRDERGKKERSFEVSPRTKIVSIG